MTQNDPAIAKKLGIEEVVHEAGEEILRVLDVEIPKKAYYGAPITRQKQYFRRLVEGVRNGETLFEIAKACGLSRERVSRIIHECGFYGMWRYSRSMRMREVALGEDEIPDGLVAGRVELAELLTAQGRKVQLRGRKMIVDGHEAHIRYAFKVDMDAGGRAVVRIRARRNKAVILVTKSEIRYFPPRDEKELLVRLH